jgi:hypothetical protein
MMVDLIGAFMAEATRSIAWDGLSFALPAAMIDQTVLTFVDKSEAPAVSVTVSQERLEGGKPGLLRYVTEQLKDIQRAVPGYTIVSQGERAAGTLPAIHVHSTVAGAGKKRVQHQLYALDEANARVLVATVTAHDTHAAQAAALLDGLAASMALGGAA